MMPVRARTPGVLAAGGHYLHPMEGDSEDQRKWVTFPGLRSQSEGRLDLNPDSVCNVFHCLPLNSMSKPGEGRGGEVWENGERERKARHAVSGCSGAWVGLRSGMEGAKCQGCHTRPNWPSHAHTPASEIRAHAHVTAQRCGLGKRGAQRVAGP